MTSLVNPSLHDRLMTTRRWIGIVADESADYLISVMHPDSFYALKGSANRTDTIELVDKNSYDLLTKALVECVEALKVIADAKGLNGFVGVKEAVAKATLTKLEALLPEETE